MEVLTNFSEQDALKQHDLKTLANKIAFLEHKLQQEQLAKNNLIEDFQHVLDQLSAINSVANIKEQATFY